MSALKFVILELDARLLFHLVNEPTSYLHYTTENTWYKMLAFGSSHYIYD